MLTDHSIHAQRRWRWPAWLAISIAGLCSLPPVILRGSAFENTLPTDLIFGISLVLHVNASVLFWLLGVLNAMTEDAVSRRRAPSGTLSYNTALFCYVTGLILMTAAGFLPGAAAVKNNYIPVLMHPVFFAGLAFCGLSVLQTAALALKGLGRNILTQPTSCALLCAHICVVAGSGLIIIDALRIPLPGDNTLLLSYFERLFWAGGHIIVAGYSFLAAALWLRLADSTHNESMLLPERIRLFINAFFIGHLLTCLYAITVYFLDNDAGVFTRQMRVFGGIAPVIAAVAALYMFVKSARKPVLPASCALFASLLLFGGGGLLGYAISGENTSVPSHYHGSIVGVTLAAMGYFFATLPAPARTRLAAVAISVYAAGQAAHISGLYFMGGYGALRKTAHGAADAALTGKIMFFAGGAAALIGAIAFSIIYFYSELKSRRLYCTAKNR